jgi:hypothetical protein
LETAEDRANADQSEANVMDEYRNLVTQQRELTRRHQSQPELEAAQHQLACKQDIAKLAGMAKGI